MRSGAHIRTETILGGQTGLVQEKQKNAEKRAVILDPVDVASSLVLETSAAMSALQYAAHKTADEGTERAQHKFSMSEVQSQAKAQKADRLLLDAVAQHPGVDRKSTRLNSSHVKIS